MHVTALVKGRLENCMSDKDAISRLPAKDTQRKVEAYAAIFGRVFSVPYWKFRQRLAELAAEYTQIPDDDGKSEWLMVRDDDDVHVLPPEACFQAPKEVVLVGFSAEVFRLVRPIGRRVESVCFRRGCWSNAYALRRDFYESLTDRQRLLITRDHRKAHAFVDFLGYEYNLYPNIICGYGSVHLGSITAACSGKLPTELRPIRDNVLRFRGEVPEFIQQIIDLQEEIAK